jgi:hypothetical protein
MTLLVQEYLMTHSLDQLKADHGVNHRIEGSKFSLNYDMLEASNTDPIACECRGLVLAVLDVYRSEIDPTKVVGHTDVMARTMDRFFNYGQDCAANVNFEAQGTRFYEKMDGTMCALYYDFQKNEWHVATRSIPEANLPIDGFGDMTFRGLFEKAIQETTGLPFDRWIERENLHPEVTYIFELCTPANRVVVEHHNYEVYSIAIRHRHGLEEDIEDFAYGLTLVPKCRTYELNSLTDMIEFVSGRDPSAYEGIVAVDKHWQRVKVKNPGYLALSRVKDSAMRSPRALVELCLLGKLDDALPLLPDHVTERAQKIEEALRGFIRDSNDSYERVLHGAILMIEDEGWDAENESDYRKAMALSVKKKAALMPYVMMRYAGKVDSFSDYIKLQTDPKTGQYKKTFLEYLLKELGA